MKVTILYKVGMTDEIITNTTLDVIAAGMQELVFIDIHDIDGNLHLIRVEDILKITLGGIENE